MPGVAGAVDIRPQITGRDAAAGADTATSDDSVAFELVGQLLTGHTASVAEGGTVPLIVPTKPQPAAVLVIVEVAGRLAVYAPGLSDAEQVRLLEGAKQYLRRPA